MLEKKLLGVLELGGLYRAPSSRDVGESRAWVEERLEDSSQRHVGGPMVRYWDCGSGGGLDLWL